MTTRSPGESRFLDVAEAARHLGTSERFVRRLVQERRIRFRKVGRFVRFTRTDLDAFADAGTVEPSVGGWTQ